MPGPKVLIVTDCRKAKPTYSYLLLIIPAVFFTGFMPAGAAAQFLHIIMDVETEYRTESVEQLNFGSLVPGTGRQEIHPGDVGAGTFSINGPGDTEVLVKIRNPGYLRHTERAVGYRIPLTLQASYANQGENNFRQANRFENNEARFFIHQPHPSQTTAAIAEAWVYIYGHIEVGRIAEGSYIGKVAIKIEYL